MDYKKMSIRQGWVTEKCPKPGVMIWSAILSGVDPCQNCDEDRRVCGGRIVNELKTFGCCGG